MKSFSRKFILLPAAVLAFASVYAQDSSTGQVFIVPVDAEGSVMEDAKVEMTRTSDDTFQASGVSLDYGFYIRGYDPTSDLGNNYGMPSWAVSPAVIGWLNPVNGTSPRYAAVPESGVYDISFYSREDTGYSVSMFELKYSSAPDEPTYPDAIYLVPGSGEKIRIEGSGGVYSATVTLPSSFKITYEPSYSYGAFIFGPAESESSVVLEPGEAVELKYATNTSATVSYDTSAPRDSENHVLISVDLSSPTYTVTVTSGIETGVGEVSAAADNTTEAVYDLYGRRLGSAENLNPGIYVVRTASGTNSKILVR